MKKALLVGINDYPGTQNDLMGCVNDITNVYDVLVKYYGFKPSDVTLLADKRATTKAILDALGKLIASGSSGDTLVFHYSGHGSQVADPEGDEADGKDEIICPYDFDWDKSYIKDDDFARIFKDLKKGVTLEVILDSCHSGTGTREMILDRKSLAGPEGGKLASSRLTTESLTGCVPPRFPSGACEPAPHRGRWGRVGGRPQAPGEHGRIGPGVPAPRRGYNGRWQNPAAGG